MSFLVATNIVASRLPDRRPTGTPHARAKNWFKTFSLYFEKVRKFQYNRYNFLTTKLKKCWHFAPSSGSDRVKQSDFLINETRQEWWSVTIWEESTHNTRAELEPNHKQIVHHLLISKVNMSWKLYWTSKMKTTLQNKDPSEGTILLAAYSAFLHFSILSLFFSSILSLRNLHPYWPNIRK